MSSLCVNIGVLFFVMATFGEGEILDLLRNESWAEICREENSHPNSDHVEKLWLIN